MTLNETINGSEVVIKVIGRLDTTTSPDLQTRIKELLDNTLTLTLELDELEYCSSAGLRVFLDTHKKLSYKKGTLIIKGANETVMQVFEATGLDSVLNLEQ